MGSSTVDRRQGLTGDKGMKAPVDCATTGNISLSGEQSIDGFTTSQSRVLVKSQTNSVENGIYDSSSGTWTRAIDSNGYQNFVKGQLVTATGGAQAGLFFQVTSANPVNVGSSAITFGATPIQTVQSASQVTFKGSLNYTLQTIGYEGRTFPSLDSFDSVDPTGVADSAAAATAAIAAASALGVRGMRLPSTYKFLSQVTLASNMVFQITGTVNVNVSEIGLLIPAAATKITLDGMGTGVIAGTCARAISSVNGNSVTDIKIRGLSISGATLAGLGYTSGIFLDGCNRVTIEDNRLSGNGFGAGTVAASADIQCYVTTNGSVNIVRNNCSSTAASINIACYNATEAHIDGNTVSGAVCGSSMASGYGIMLYSSVSDVCRRSTINGNVVQNTGGSGIYIQDVLQVTCANNVLDNVAQTQTDVSLPVGGIALNTPTDASVTGNMIRKSGKSGIVSSNGTRVSISGGSATDCGNAGVYLRGSGDGTSVVGVVLENNSINLYADSTAKAHLLIDVISRTSKTGTNGIDLQNVSDSKVQGVSSGNARTGLNVLAGANNTVSINCLDNGTDAANTYDGITNGATSTTYIGCRSGNSGATGQRYGLNTTGNYCSILNCNLTRNQTDGYSISGTAVQKSGNRLSTSATPDPISGSGVLVGGTVTITNNEVRSGDRIVCSRFTAGGTQGTVGVSTITNATSFIMLSSNASDTSTYIYAIDH